jgi:LmbE family N-acetylglucosaminyl deacetylase
MERNTISGMDKKKVFIHIPHLDDAVLSCGGFIVK